MWNFISNSLDKLNYKHQHILNYKDVIGCNESTNIQGEAKERCISGILWTLQITFLLFLCRCALYLRAGLLWLGDIWQHDHQWPPSHENMENSSAYMARCRKWLFLLLFKRYVFFYNVMPAKYMSFNWYIPIWKASSSGDLVCSLRHASDFLFSSISWERLGGMAGEG